MAEFIMKDLAIKAKLDWYYEISSAAVSREELGNPVYPPARRELQRHGISCTGKTARQMTKTDYAVWDYLIGMDEDNLRRMQRITGGDPEGKMSLLLSWAGIHRDVDDPWYTGDFSSTWNDVLTGCTALLKKTRP